MNNANDTSRARVYGSLLLGFILGFSFFFSSKPILAASYNIHPAACKATFLDQAFPMRWHEFYLMNPASNLPTYVICPIQYEPGFSGTFSAGLTGSAMPGASTELPSCFFAAHSLWNNNQPPYASGLNRTFVKFLPSQWGETGERSWLAFGSFTASEINSSVGGDAVAMSLFCKLPSGYSISTYAFDD